MRGSLVDGGANGGLLGDDVRVLEYVEGAHVDVTGIADSEVNGLKIAQAAGIVDTVADGPIIVIMSQYADLGKGKTIHSKGQMEHFGMLVDDTSRRAGGRQCVVTTEGYVIPLHVREGLPRIDMRAPTDEELDKYPHVFITSDAPWNPAVLDTEFDEDYFDAVMEDPDVQARRDARDPRVDDHGFLRSREDYQALFAAQDAFIESQLRRNPVTQEIEVYYDASSTAIRYLDPHGTEMPYVYSEPETRFEREVNKLSAMPNRLRKFFPDTDKLKPYLGWFSGEKIKAMLDKTT